MSRTPSLDLSEVTKLKYVIFSCNGSDVQWITTTVKTAESKNPQQVAIHLYADIPAQIREAVRWEWEIMDFKLGPSKDHIPDGERKGRYRRSCAEAAARANEERGR